MTRGEKGASHQALYRTYRSKSLDEVVGQQHVTTILSRALEKGKIAHAYLFTGPRGVGKTSVARILAHEINKLPYDEETSHPDIIEIDAASNRRIDDIRDLREKVNIAPASAKYKVYIIDEVHMLTGESFNAFLKTLEEPPEHVVFILATTDAHKLPVTITSRTQRFAFRSIGLDDAVRHLESIAKAENIAITKEALELIAQHGDGSFRDSISLLDQLSSLATDAAPIDPLLVEQVLGLASHHQIEALVNAYESHDQQAIIDGLADLGNAGISPTVIADQLLHVIRDRIISSPKLIELLDTLVEVMRSPRPDIKLLSALLGQSSVPSSKPVLAAPAPPELRPLEREAEKPRPSEKTVRKAAKREPTAPAEPLPSAPKKAKAPQDTAFDWDAYVAHMREHHVALASILAKCKAESEGDIVTIYTGTAFWKKKLDDVRYQPILNEALYTLGMGDLTIETVPTTAPPKDSQAAAVAAIMGGGEEVSLEDS